MSRTIGGLSFDAMHGTVNLPGDGLEVLQRPGRDCARYKAIGQRASESTVRTVKFCANAAAADSEEAAYAAARGELVTVVDAHGSSYYGVAVLDCQIQNKQAVIQGGAAKIRLEAIWTLQAGDPVANA
jgi:hypothetical protein